MNIEMVKKFQKLVEEFKKQVKDELGLEVTTGTFNYDLKEVSIKISARMVGENMTLEEDNYIEYVKRYGETPLEIGKEYKIKTTMVTFIGMTKTSNQRNGYRPTFENNGKKEIYKISVIDYLKNRGL